MSAGRQRSRCSRAPIANHWLAAASSRPSTTTGVHGLLGQPRFEKPAATATFCATTDLAADYGSRLCLLGDWKAGMPLHAPRHRVAGPSRRAPTTWSLPGTITAATTIRRRCGRQNGSTCPSPARHPHARGDLWPAGHGTEPPRRRPNFASFALISLKTPSSRRLLERAASVAQPLGIVTTGRLGAVVLCASCNSSITKLNTCFERKSVSSIQNQRPR